MIYASSVICQAQLPGIEAIDYFIAQHCLQNELSDLDEADKNLAFHLILAVSWHQRQGHNCVLITALSERCLWHDPAVPESGFVFPVVAELQRLQALLQTKLTRSTPVRISQDRLYLLRAWQYEQLIAQHICQRLSQRDINVSQVESLALIWPSLFPVSESSETDWQQVAVANAIGRRLAIICGGPGTGKTYTVTRLLAAQLAARTGQETRIMMAAPTGKAAQRLNESIQGARVNLQQQGVDANLLAGIPKQASTLHRLLGYRPDKMQLTYNTDNQLPVDLLLIDEVSMVDTAMMAQVLAALPEQAQLILLGDVDQLPSVGAGCVLADLTDSNQHGYSQQSAELIAQISGQKVSVCDSNRYDHQTMLQKSHRFAGAIGELAKQVIHCDMPSSWQQLAANQVSPQQAISTFQQRELSYLNNKDIQLWLKKAVQQYYGAVLAADDLASAFAELAKFRILVATRQGELGVETLNTQIEQLLASHFNGMPISASEDQRIAVKPDHPYRGRPIMVTENDYGIELFNGDIGIVWPDEQGRLTAWFETENNNFRRISLARLPTVEPVFAMTIHKTQGSEFGHVAVLLPDQGSELLSPELLYTGITRARQQLTIGCCKQVWQQSLQARIERYSGLPQLLSE